MCTFFSIRSAVLGHFTVKSDVCLHSVTECVFLMNALSVLPSVEGQCVCLYASTAGFNVEFHFSYIVGQYQPCCFAASCFLL